MNEDVLERAASWDGCYPGNTNINMLVSDLCDEVNDLRGKLTDAADCLEYLLSFIRGDDGHQDVPYLGESNRTLAEIRSVLRDSSKVKDRERSKY